MSIFCKPIFLLLLSWVLSIGNVSAVFAGNITVSPNYGTLDSTAQKRVGAGSVEIIPLGELEPGNRYSIQIASDNRVYPDISAFVVDRENLDAFRSSQRFSGIGFSKRLTKSPGQHQPTATIF